MKDIKTLNGTFRRVTRAPGGLFGIETIVLDKGKVIDYYEDDPNYPTITLSMFGKQSFNEAQVEYDKASQAVKVEK